MPPAEHIADVVVATPGHPDCFCVGEPDALEVARTRLPSQSLLLAHRVHHRTGREAWEPWRGFP